MKKSVLFTSFILISLLAILPHCTDKPTIGDPDPSACLPECGPFNFCPDVPHAPNSVIATEDGIQIAMNQLSWQTFVALCWPASSVQNGIPDRNKMIGGTKGTGLAGAPPGVPPGPTVWETFKASEDIFLPGGVRPSPFDAPPIIPDSCYNPDGKKVLVRTAKIADALTDTLEAGTNKPVFDQNGNIVWSEVKLNEVTFDFIVENGYYNKANLPKSNIYNYPQGSNLTSDVGSIRVKSSWKILTNPKDTLRYYAREAVIKEGGDTCQIVLVGLVGLHIVHKTEFNEAWVWSTFEHVDNAPTLGDTAALKRDGWSFFNPEEFAKCDTCYNEEPTDEQIRNKVPTQVVRVTPIPSGAASANKEWQQRLRCLNPNSPDFNIWQYYELVNTQWNIPGSGTHPKDNDIKPPYLANTTLETYLQGAGIGSGPSHGCINCHRNSRFDFGFQLYNAQE